MRIICSVLASAALASLVPVRPIAAMQESRDEAALTNADVLSFVEAELRPAEIVSTIEARTVDFDTSLEALALLARSGAAPEVLEAMARATALVRERSRTPSPVRMRGVAWDLPARATAALAEAGDLYAAGDSEGAIPVIEGVIETLEPLAAAFGDTLAASEPHLFETLLTAWLYLAAAHWTLEDRDAADEALDRIVRLDPLFVLDAETAGKQLADRLERRKKALATAVR